MWEMVVFIFACVLCDCVRESCHASTVSSFLSSNPTHHSCPAQANKNERAKKSPTFKDLDFMEHHPEGLMLEATTYSALMHTIQNDVRVSAPPVMSPPPLSPVVCLSLLPLPTQLSSDLARCGVLICSGPCVAADLVGAAVSVLW